MSVHYQAVYWNPDKKRYDAVLAGGVLLYLALFIGVGATVHPNATIETLLIRGLGTAALLLLHIILSIGPLARLDARFLPLLYNRRHAGVTMFLLALAHGTFSLVQFHAFGNVSPLVSLFGSGSFQVLGFGALVILFLMAATSHDFWLKNLSPAIWKRLHMLVYAAYALILLHVCFGALQSERSPLLLGTLMLGAAIVTALHVAAGAKEHRTDAKNREADGFVDVCRLDEIADCRAKVVVLNGERVAVFRQGNTVSALSNVCAHQNGPLGEGKIIDGCVTCPWHGYQYLPETGKAPAPFTERVPKYPAQVRDGRVLICVR